MSFKIELKLSEIIRVYSLIKLENSTMMGKRLNKSPTISMWVSVIF